MSGLIFAICADVLLVGLQGNLRAEDELARAFADDAAVVIADDVKSIGTVSKLFKDFERISCLELNVKKTLFIPLSPLSSARGLRTFIHECCQAWRNIGIETKGKYLGFIIGPGRSTHSWEAPLRTYTQRVSARESSHSGLLWNSIYYNTFVVSTLEFVAQLDPVHEEVLESERAALRQLAPGPGNWIAVNDLENLCQFGIGTGFRTTELNSYAAKLQLIRDLGLAHVSSKAELIRTVQADYLRPPFAVWHDRSFATILRDNFSHFQQQGIIPQSTRSWAGNFQKLAREAIAQQICPYDLEENIRKNNSRW